MSTHLLVSEIFDSIQGEGASQGQACTFLRLAGCNLACAWCDTEYSWNWKVYDVRTHTTRLSVAELQDRLLTARHIVITGGEPLLQQRALRTLFDGLPTVTRIEIETNGTLDPEPFMLQRVDQWNVSPKLGHSGEPETRRVNKAALLALRDTDRAWMKLVVDSADMQECEALIADLSWPRHRVYLMPQARTREELALAEEPVKHMAIEHGLLFTSRLHLQLWNGARGR